MENAIHKIERRMVKQEQLVVQIAKECTHLQIELEDLRKAATQPRYSIGTSDLASKVTSLQLDIPKPIKPQGSKTSSLTKDTLKWESEPVREDDAVEGVADSQTQDPLTLQSRSSTGVSSEVKPSRMRIFKNASKLSSESLSETTKGTEKGVNMTDGALGLRKKVKKKILTFMVPELNNTRVFGKSHPFRGKFRKVTEQPAFEIFFGFFVIASAVLIGVEIESEATRPNHSGTSFLLAQSLCAIAFITEIVVRLISYGSMFFGRGSGRVAKEWKWNMFDLLCLVTTIADIFCELFIFDGHHELLTTFRQFRIIRAARVIRTMRFAREFRKMSYALQYSGSTLLWALITLCCVIFFFATALTQATTVHLQSFGGTDLDPTSRRLKDFYGTMPQSFHSLFQAISGGKDWDELIRPLMEFSWILPTLFISYIALTIFGVMNVLTSVFVESAVASYQHYKDILIQENLASMQVYIEHLKEIFVQIDYDNSGEISLDELEVFLNDPSLQQYLESIDVHPDDARTLFRLLDKDNSGFINIDEFCNGCLRLKGEAKSFDIHCIIYENERIMHKFQEFITYLERGFLARVEKNVDKRICNLPVLAAPQQSHASRNIASFVPVTPTPSCSLEREREQTNESSFSFVDKSPGPRIKTKPVGEDAPTQAGLPEIGNDAPVASIRSHLHLPEIGKDLPLDNETEKELSK